MNPFCCRLSRCTSIVTGEEGSLPRCKPFKYTYEKEIVIYPILRLKLNSAMLQCLYHNYLSCCSFFLHFFLFFLWHLDVYSSRMLTSRNWITSLQNVSFFCTCCSVYYSLVGARNLRWSSLSISRNIYCIACHALWVLDIYLLAKHVKQQSHFWWPCDWIIIIETNILDGSAFERLMFII